MDFSGVQLYLSALPSLPSINQASQPERLLLPSLIIAALHKGPGIDLTKTEPPGRPGEGGRGAMSHGNIFPCPIHKAEVRASHISAVSRITW